jgi:hypothetical protein
MFASSLHLLDQLHHVVDVIAESLLLRLINSSHFELAALFHLFVRRHLPPRVETQVPPQNFSHRPPSSILHCQAWNYFSSDIHSSVHGSSVIFPTLWTPPASAILRAVSL